MQPHTTLWSGPLLLGLVAALWLVVQRAWGRVFFVSGRAHDALAGRSCHGCKDDECRDDGRTGSAGCRKDKS